MKSTRVFILVVAVALVAGSFAIAVGRAETGDHNHDHEQNDGFWEAVLKGKSERPTPRDTHAHGKVVFELSADGLSLSYVLTVKHIENVIMAHIHLGGRDVAGPIIVWLYPVGGPPAAAPGAGPFSGVLATGSFDASKFVGPFVGKSMSDLIEALNTHNAYVNVHTDDGQAPTNTGPGDFPGGEIRGQLKPLDDDD